MDNAKRTSIIWEQKAAATPSQTPVGQAIAAMMKMGSPVHVDQVAWLFPSPEATELWSPQPVNCTAYFFVPLSLGRVNAPLFSETSQVVRWQEQGKSVSHAWRGSELEITVFSTLDKSHPTST